MTRNEAISRWDAFLTKIEARAHDTFLQAEDGCAMLLDINALDPQPMTIAWMAIENALRELVEKIDETWNAKVEPSLGDDTKPEHAKGVMLQRHIELKKENLEVRIFADAARKIVAQARINLAKEHKCAQCGAALPVVEAFFRSRHVTCPFCNTVNTFVPGSTVSAVEYFCCHHLAREKTIELLRRSTANPDSEQALREYVTAYLRARIELVPEYKKDFEKDLAGKMAFFYERQR
jgi:hypothetical protein